MACYILSNDNRFYAAVESQYGNAEPIHADNRFPAFGLRARQLHVVPRRRDKTGSRTNTAAARELRRQTEYRIKTYLTTSDAANRRPAMSPLIQAALGAQPIYGGANTLAERATGTQLRFSQLHNLQEGCGVVLDGEIRFVVAVLDTHTVSVNAPYSNSPSAGAQTGATATYSPATLLPGVSIYDYWQPTTAVQRLLIGAAVSELTVDVNGDFHEFQFAGPAADVIDSESFETGQGALEAFPVEPALAAFSSSPVPGHLGQIWLGTPQNRLQTVTEARLLLDNQVETRHNEFGSLIPRCLVPGNRSVRFSLSFFERESESHHALYQAARHRDPISLMLQLGQNEGQLCGIYLKSLVPTVPEFDDSETRLKWSFTNSQAQGVADDEIYISFG